MIKVGILGGGQLGRMLLQQAANYPVETWVMENDASCPAAHLCHHFVPGNIRNYEDVLRFGRQVQKLTIEIENVNVDALEVLEKEGIEIIPKPAVLRIIKNKIAQKNFYQQYQLPTPEFVVTQKNADVLQHKALLPAVHKLAEGGYDGKGVQIINREVDVDKAFDEPAILEKKVELLKEIAMMLAVDTEGEIAIYPPVEMIFDPYLNLLDYQVCPAALEKEVLWKAEAIAIKLVKAFNSAGLFAVEMLIDRNKEVWVNETAPRVHNSGHHTIEAHFSSQYDMLWRILLGYPLGNTDMITPSSLVNLVGSTDSNGTTNYKGLEEVLKMENTFVHLYGKAEVKPGRKMGHVTILAPDRQELIYRAQKVKQCFSV